MSTKENTLLKEALKLPPKNRATLAEKILQSLEVNAKEEVLDAWVEEAEKRWQAFKRGEIPGIPAEELSLVENILRNGWASLRGLPFRSWSRLWRV